MINLKVVTTCVNYTDYLLHTLPYNKSMYEDLTVISSPEDKDTHYLCEKYNTPVLTMPGLGKLGREFNWVGAYNYFLSIYKNCWIIITDSDVFLPPRLNTYLDNLDLSDTSGDTIYYTSRVYLPMDYEKIYDNIEIAKKAERFDNLGWSIIPPHCWGYFMLFYNNSTNIKKWTFNDVVFGELFTNKIILPIELSVAHIPHGTWSDWGKNFNGRQTPPLEKLHQDKLKI